MEFPYWIAYQIMDYLLKLPKEKLDQLDIEIRDGIYYPYQRICIKQKNIYVFGVHSFRKVGVISSPRYFKHLLLQLCISPPEPISSV